MTPDDWPRVEAIFVEGIETRNATFDTEPPSWEDWDGAHLDAHRFVAEEGGDVIGWIAGSMTSSRACYAGVIEHSVYVAAHARGRGVGRALLEAFVSSAEAAGSWTIQAQMFPENEATIRLHERAGFRLVGRRERIAQLDGVWRDTVLLERRSDSVR
jgi:phosphinothricin acetyltransferase